MVEAGDIVFTKKVKLSQAKGATEIGFKEPVASLLLGFERKGKKIEWNEKSIAQCLASLGLFYSDDIAECIGDEAHTKLIKFLEEKYK